MATLKSIPATPADLARHSNALTAEQYRIVLERIAGCCDTLRNVLIEAIEAEEHQVTNLIDAGKMLATYIGGMADNAARPGGAIIGNHDCWNYGRAFAGAGKEA
ncbi:hypothetical protein [Hydrogenophaga sp. BPS33]|uniref:hypothetical protein n=1 Tax=Hydrogenophaga sp. BPS33 TaxID=2651974 RepID=UPI00131FDB46|nr:hypothetical protein [Hydrogenophaga sp. BPS33]QHE86503.1 hypothetical protein F9K07_17150 [Hydrogenophaga sp. BPS33]